MSTAGIAETLQYAYWVPNVSGGLVVSTIEQRTHWGLDYNVRLARVAEAAGFDYALSQIRFTAGYGAPTDVPAAIRQAMLLLVTQWYEHRQVTGTGTALPFSVEALLAPYRRVRL